MKPIEPCSCEESIALRARVQELEREVSRDASGTVCVNRALWMQVKSEREQARAETERLRKAMECQRLWLLDLANRGIYLDGMESALNALACALGLRETYEPPAATQPSGPAGQLPAECTDCGYPQSEHCQSTTCGMTGCHGHAQGGVP